MVPEEFGNCVKIGTEFIPAVNIQVEDVPGYVYFEDGTHAWYGVYFEIMFEDGALWVVSQGSHEEELLCDIMIVEFPKFHEHNSVADANRVAIGNSVKTWEEFVTTYNERRNVRG